MPLGVWGLVTEGTLLPRPGAHGAEPDCTWHRFPFFQEASGVLGSQQWQDYAMCDFYVALASEAVYRDVCPLIAPDFWYTNRRVEREFVQRRARDVNLNDEIRWRDYGQIDLFTLPDGVGVLDVEA